MPDNQHAKKVRAGRLGGLKGGPARARVLTPAERSHIAHLGYVAQQQAMGHPVNSKPNLRTRRKMKKGGSHAESS